MLVGVYQLGILRREPRLIKYLFGSDPSELFYKLSDMVLLLMDELWKRAGFSFAQILQAVRNMRYVGRLSYSLTLLLPTLLLSSPTSLLSYSPTLLLPYSLTLLL
jgi:hypothetical protein